jgi:hypothetical protein
MFYHLPNTWYSAFSIGANAKTKGLELATSAPFVYFGQLFGLNIIS